MYQTLNTRRPDTNAGQRPSPLAAEVGLADVVVLEEVGASAGLLDGADLKHVGAIGNGERHVGVLLYQQDRGPGRVELLDDVEDLLHQDGGQAHGGRV